MAYDNDILNGITEFIIIARWDTTNTSKITFQNFVRDGQSFIPVFSDLDEFRAQTAGSGYESDGVAFKRDILFTVLSSEDLLVLNPGGRHPIPFRKSDLLTASQR